MLVPYDGGAGRLIERLSEPELSPYEAAGLMRRAQRLSLIHIFSYLRSAVGAAAYQNRRPLRKDQAGPAPSK